MGVPLPPDAACSPYVQKLIRRKARQLCRACGPGSAAHDDWVQELTAFALQKRGCYDPARGASRDTFFDRVIESKVRMILRARARLKRAPERSAQSLDQGTGAEPTPLSATVTQADLRRRTGSGARDDERERDEAVEAALAALPPAARAVAEQLKGHTANGTAVAMGISRRQVDNAVRLIRQRLEQAGLGGAL